MHPVLENGVFFCIFLREPDDDRFGFYQFTVPTKLKGGKGPGMRAGKHHMVLRGECR